ncbi:aspartate-tRNA ligase [Aspergillus pseudocaelatus]|uniref:aspartate--tRNA ligase n=1 Tax=Aspergillus pseudocaelatus TaxID=1825620 RepID=A0ABQ6X024_9EURO|nr:aspartate-tRNA ligase [Aspergillus pseudocaelatus]
MPASEHHTTSTVSKTAGPTPHDMEGPKLSFDARVNSVFQPDHPELMHLELRVQHKVLQAVIRGSAVGKATWDIAQKVTAESIVRVTGHVLQSTSDSSEVNVNTIDTIIHVSDLDVIAWASPNLPLSSCHRKTMLSHVGIEERLTNRILDVRFAASGALFKLHSGMCQLVVEFLCSQGFHWIHTPRIITATVPGDNEYFHLPYFGKDAWLAQSSQHHKQMALSMDMQRVFEIGPVFRAEVKSSTSMRHLTEFTVLDIAMAFEDDYQEVVDLIESMLLFIFKELQGRKQYRQLIALVQEMYPGFQPFRVGLDEHGKVPRITFLEAKRILREEIGLASDDSKNFTVQEEAALGRHFREFHPTSTDVFTITQYPASLRQFNSQAHPDAPEFSNTWDIIVGGREICSGSQRIHSYQELCEAMRAGVCGPPLDPEAEQWQPYLAAFKAGMPPHGGCGLGLNRLLQSFLGLDDVRETTLFPRDVNRLRP